MTQIYELLSRVMGDVGAIPKNRENSAMKYKFRGVDDAINHVGPFLQKNGVCIATEVTEHRVDVHHFTEQWQDKGKVTEKQKATYHATLLMKITFFAPDGSSVVNTMAGEGLDTSGDKATNKAMSAAFKYGLFFGLCIPVDPKSIDDSDRERQASRRRERETAEANATGVGNAQYASQARKVILKLDSVEALKRQIPHVKASQLYTSDEQDELLALIQERLGALNGVKEPATA